MSKQNRSQPFRSRLVEFFTENSSIQFENFDKSTFLFSLFGFLVLTSLALLIRILIARYYRVEFPYRKDMPFWERSIIFNPNEQELCGFGDFNYYYITWAKQWYQSSSWTPYSNWEEINTAHPETMYSYPPLFLYFIVLFWRPGFSVFWIGFPIILTDAMCAGVVFLILKEIISGENQNPIAFFGGVLFTLTPLNLLYIGAYFLNPGPVTLLTLLSIYFALRNNWKISFSWLALATMTKQNALFFTYPLFMVFLAWKAHNKSIKHALLEGLFIIILFLFICFILSLPYLFLSPADYGAHLLLPGRPLKFTGVIVIPTGAECITFIWSLLYLNAPGWLVNIVAYGNNSLLFFILSAFLIVVLLSWRAINGELTKADLLLALTCYGFLTHIFMPRGVFRFYFTYFTPLLLAGFLAFCFQKEHTLFLSSLLLVLASSFYLGFNFGLLLLNRIFMPFYIFIWSVILILCSLLSTIFRNQNFFFVPKYLPKKALL
ncbi:MAG: hypothetical protein U9O98_04770 [Asgard group archaeon]|nr:hypothetical protein [Asgard group archaeon]